jgi:hypothetical protein
VSLIPEQLIAEVEELRKEGLDIDLVERDGLVNLVLRSCAIPPSMNKDKSDILLRIPMGYPNARPDMFWTDEDLLLKDGRVPRSADSIEEIIDRRWRRFSWHPQAWNPGRDNIRTYLEFVNCRIRRME